MSEIKPTREEGLSVVLDIRRHSTQVEYYLTVLNLNPAEYYPLWSHSKKHASSIPQRPHDICGKWNKFTWPVLDGLTLEPRDRALKVKFLDYLIHNHTQQYGYLSHANVPEINTFFKNFDLDTLLEGSWEHQQLLNIKFTSALILLGRDVHRQQYHHQMWNGPERNPFACDSDMCYGAIDTICAQLENRPYYGGKHTFADIAILPAILRNHPSKKRWINQMLEDMQEHPQLDLSLIRTVDDATNYFDLPFLMHQRILERTKRAADYVNKDYKSERSLS
ncbi:MAG: hypothetical protein V2A62_04465 [Candidatus Woesearchaeota archaeon]